VSPRNAAARPPPPIHDSSFQTLKQRIIERTGHHYYADKDAHLWERIVGRMLALGIDDLAAYAQQLDNSDDGEWRQLESAITINETFFFRFAEQFDVLRRILLPRLIERAGGEKRLRIWSVGCSTGAEPYSLAILLDDLLGPRLADWRIVITGTDIDEAALETARSARYSSWTLRTLGEAERERLFEREGDAYRLKPRYRGLVRFEHHNMMALLDPAAALQFTEFDLILCRNVLIYFREDVARSLVGALAARLSTDGYLLIGHAETSPDLAAVAGQAEVGGILAYRRLDAQAEADGRGEAHVSTQPPAITLRPRPSPLPRKAPVGTPPPARRSPPPVQAPPPAPITSRDDLRAALGRGEARQALNLADVEAGGRSTGPVTHYLAALGALALGETARAEEGFRKALYLDNSFAMAHYLLGRHLIADGRAAEGRRMLANAMRAAAALDPAAELPEGDGMTAADLIAAVRSALA
jgi:chemotaxis protein methyltransferase CheR